ncbi:acetolactate synthase large subunit [Paludisphaera mucosa]|uniref:Acetolactate synthase large subunit n=1 Tax=Paludisphaera mucosa TaxID=3030827 RepID=A0ABT6FC56_9BACT|nr:acetolactate synthase large subunit [Paludisphaera mucosa]MDG3005175.1 acetolactate synthase large subunit [Paludisphaera mucosa]
MNGAQSLFKSLVDAGVATCFANPGTSEMQLVYEIGMTDAVRPVLCLQEDVVTGAADGYGRMKGAPAFTLLHVACGFANGVAMLHNAARANTPVVNVVGVNASYHQANYPEHELVNGRASDLARAVSHWCGETRSASHLGELGVEAAALAKTGKVCTIVAPNDYHWSDATPPPSPPAPSARPQAAREAIARAAEMLSNGKKTGLVLGGLALQGEALESAGRIAAKTGVTLLAETFPSRFLSRGEGRPPVEPIPYEFEIGVKFLEPYEQLVFVGAGLPVATFAYRNKPTLKSPPGCDLFAMASADQDLDTALHALAEATGATHTPAVRQPRNEPPPASGELTAAAIGQTLCSLLPADAILVDEAATNGPAILAATKGARAHDLLNPVNGGAIGGGPPMALGAAIACPDRKVVLLQADGSGMYTVQALWSMAREKADVVVVVLKNDAYAILGLEMERVREREENAKMKSMLDLDDPSIGWVEIATGLGVSATRAATAEEFRERFEAALAAGGPHLIECRVSPTKDWQALEEYVHRTR